MDKIRISFSGGGFRATFYCLGAFRRLVEVDLWEKVCRIDSVSGGSITAAAIMSALAQGKFKDVVDFDKKVTEPVKKLGQCRFRERVTIPVLLLILTLFMLYLYLTYCFRVPSILSLFGFIFCLVLLQPRQLFSKNFELFLDRLFFKGKLINSIPAYPEWSVNATCLNTGKRFRFKQGGFGGHKIGVTSDKNDIKVSFAVACSAAFPQVFAPLKLKLKPEIRKFYDKWWTDNPILNNNPPKQVFLSDGGVYDNLGSENILKEKEPFIILDAGGYISQWSTDVNPNWLERTGRIIATALDQIIALRRRLLFRKTKEHEGIILILGRPVKDYLEQDKFKDFGNLSNEVTEKMPEYELFPEEIDKLIADLRTDLDTFHDIEVAMLMWAGAIRIDVAIKRYLKKYLNEEQFKSIPKKPNFCENRIREILSKGGKVGIPLGVFYKNFKEV